MWPIFRQVQALPHSFIISACLCIILRLYLYFMQQAQERTELVQRIREMIRNKGAPKRSRWVRSDWRAAEESLLAHDCFKKEDSLPALRKLADLHKAYETKSIPSFYSYFTIRSILQRNISVEEELQQQTIKTEKSENQFQNIAVFIFMRDSLVQQCRLSLLRDNLEKHRSATLLSVRKVNEWQESLKPIIEYPVFFEWKGSPYLLQLLEDKEGVIDQQEQYLPEPNPLLLKKHSEMPQQPIVSQCLAILKAQKARLLELTLSLPFYAKVVDRSKQQPSQSQQRIIVHPFRSKVQSSLRKSVNNQSKVSSLSQQQLKVIKKYRSLKNVRKESIRDSREKATFFPRLEVVNKNVQTRIQVLKEKVKHKTESSRVQIVREEKGKAAKSSIRILFQKQVDMKQVVLDKLTLIASANLNRRQKDNPISQSTKQKQEGSKRRQSLATDDKIETIIRESKQIAQLRGKQKKQLSQKGQSLKSLKEDLFAKFKNTEKKAKPNINISPKKKVLPKEQTIASINASLSQQLLQERKKIQQKKQKTLEETNKLQSELAYKMRVLEQKQMIAKQIEVELSLKKMRANELALKLEATKAKAVEDNQDNTLAQIKKLKQKKLMEYNLEKQKILEVQDSLQKKLSEEEVKHGQLSQQKTKEEGVFKGLYEKQVQKLRQEQLQQEMNIAEKMRENEQKLKEYEQKMRAEQQRLMTMQKQLAEWNEKESMLLAQLKKEREREEVIQRQRKAERQRRIQEQLTELEEQESQFLTKYKEANHTLTSQLEQLKKKNALLQQRLK